MKLLIWDQALLGRALNQTKAGIAPDMMIFNRIGKARTIFSQFSHAAHPEEGCS